MTAIASVERHSSLLARALRRARTPILAIAVTYACAVIIGALMAHAHNSLALRTRDALVARAYARDPAAIAFREGRRVEAAIWDFGRNLMLGAVPSTLAGLAIIVPFPVAAYRGWVGGIVSVNGKHQSRFVSPRQAIYYLSVIVLQLIPYSLAGGAGVYMGVAYYRARAAHNAVERILGVPAVAVRDTLLIYRLVVPLFLTASLVEFLA